MRRFHRVLAPLCAALAIGCGARSPLDVLDDSASLADAGSPPLPDGGAGAVDGAQLDSGAIDARDARVDTGVGPAVDAGAMGELYVAAGPPTQAAQVTLFRFDPANPALVPVGTISCDTGSAWLLSMTSDRKGVMYFADSAGYLYRVERAGLACKKVLYGPGQAGFGEIQISWDLDPHASPARAGLFAITQDGRLATIDLETSVLTPVGTTDQNLLLPRLAASEDGPLYGMSFPSGLVAIDRFTAHVVAIGEIPQLEGQGGGFGLAVRDVDAFAFRGTDYPGAIRFAQFSLSRMQVVTVGDLATGGIVNDVVGACFLGE